MRSPFRQPRASQWGHTLVVVHGRVVWRSRLDTGPAEPWHRGTRDTRNALAGTDFPGLCGTCGAALACVAHYCIDKFARLRSIRIINTVFNIFVVPTIVLKSNVRARDRIITSWTGDIGTIADTILFTVHTYRARQISWYERRRTNHHKQSHSSHSFQPNCTHCSSPRCRTTSCLGCQIVTFFNGHSHFYTREHNPPYTSQGAWARMGCPSVPKPSNAYHGFTQQ